MFAMDALLRTAALIRAAIVVILRAVRTSLSRSVLLRGLPFLV